MSGAPMRKPPIDWREIGAAIVSALVFAALAVALIWLTTYLAAGFVSAVSVEVTPR